MNTVLGLVFDPLGLATRTRWSNDPADFWNPVRHDVWALPPDEVRSVQPSRIPINLGHHRSRVVGEAIYLERSERGLIAVGHVDGSFAFGGDDVYWSAEVTANRSGDADTVIDGLAIVTRPAQLGLRPLAFYPGRLDYPGCAARWNLDRFERALLDRATESHLHRRSGTPLVVHDLDGASAAREFDRLDARSAAGAIETRSATAVDVHHGRRELDLLISPCETPTTIYESGRRCVETFARGAFHGGADPSRVKVNRGHVRERVIGKALRLDPWAREGLTGTVRLSRVREADECFALIEDGLLGVSAGFGVEPGGDEWRGNQRRIKRAFLDHIALTEDPAYVGARVTDVRSGRPNLERALAGTR